MNRILGQSLPGEIRNIKKTIEEYAITPVNFRGGWYEFSEPMSYVSATQIAVDNTEVDLSKIFSPGDPIRLKQGGDYKYFYCTQVTATQLTLKAGTDFTVADASITDLAKGVTPSPVGFPYIFEYNPSFTGGVANQPSSSSFRFWMNGPICTVDLHFDNDDLSGGPVASLFCNLPVNASSEFSDAANAPFYPCTAVNNFNLQTAGAKLSTTQLEIQIIEYPGTGGFGAWQNSTNGVGLDITLSYPVAL